jgi:chemotaxis protein CheD
MISVGMGETKLCSDPGEVLCALGLGSCVGVAVFDAACGLAGMCHIVLPSSSVAGGKATEAGRYADTGVPRLLAELESAGAIRESIRVAIAGGAELFKGWNHEGSILRIGQRNVEAVKQALGSSGLAIQAEDTGGNCGRSLSLNVGTGVVSVRAFGRGDSVLADLADRAVPVEIERRAA